MITNLCNITSFNNLGKKGQISTVLILIMVAALIFILVTINLGQTSLTATNLANAADSGALLLGSQLCTRAHVFYQTLGGLERCRSGGWASVFFAIIGAGIGWWIGGPPGAAYGGAIGGAFGAAYAGTPVLQGAIMGFMIGAAIGAGIGSGAEAGTGAAASESAALENAALAQGCTYTEAAGAYQAAMATYAGQYATIGAITGGTLSASSAVYNQYVLDKMTSGAFESAARQLSGLTEYERYRESVFLQVLAQTIDDPNETVDENDSDQDGDEGEDVPFFQYWWERREDSLESIIPELKGLIQNFLDGPATDFKKVVEGYYTTPSEYVPGYLEHLSRQEVEGSDGWVVELARALEYSKLGLDLSFWEPGTPLPGSSHYHDEVDKAAKILAQVVADIKATIAIRDSAGGLEALVDQWETWTEIFYNPNPGSDADYYDLFYKMIHGDGNSGGLEGWKTEIEAIRDSLPVCQFAMDPWGEVIGYQNPPCQASVDADLDDEFTNAIAVIDSLISEMEAFRTACADFYTNMDNTIGTATTPWGGLNPVTYTWNDSRGDHSITAEVGHYQLASTINVEHGGWLKKEYCLQLVNYSDDGSRCWVRVTRKDPANKDVGIFGMIWNRTQDTEFTTTKMSRVSYNGAGDFDPTYHYTPKKREYIRTIGIK